MGQGDRLFATGKDWGERGPGEGQLGESGCSASAQDTSVIPFDDWGAKIRTLLEGVQRDRYEIRDVRGLRVPLFEEGNTQVPNMEDFPLTVTIQKARRGFKNRNMSNNNHHHSNE